MIARDWIITCSAGLIELEEIVKIERHIAFMAKKMHSIQATLRYLHLDIAKFILVFSFMLAHFFPHPLGVAVYWNTGGFVLMSGYITGLLLPRKHLGFYYGTVKFLKINLWLSIYFLLMYGMYAMAGKADNAYAATTTFMSVLEYIALFYLLVPFLCHAKHRILLSLIVYLTIIIINYFIFSLSKDGYANGIANILFLGGNGDINCYPILSFVNIGILGFIFKMIEDAIPLKKYIMFFIFISSICIYIADNSKIISIWTSRYPPLLFYNIYSLAVFSVLIEFSMLVGKLKLNFYIENIIHSTAKYSIIIFVIHHPLFILMNKLNVKSFVMTGKYLGDLAVSVAIVITVTIVLCAIINNTIKFLPRRIEKLII